MTTNNMVSCLFCFNFVFLIFCIQDEGVPFWCVVLRCEILKEASTLTVSSLMKDINGQIEPAEASLDCIMPGSRLNFTYEKVCIALLNLHVALFLI